MTCVLVTLVNSNIVLLNICCTVHTQSRHICYVLNFFQLACECEIVNIDLILQRLL